MVNYVPQSRDSLVMADWGAPGSDRRLQACGASLAHPLREEGIGEARLVGKGDGFCGPVGRERQCVGRMKRQQVLPLARVTCRRSPISRCRTQPGLAREQQGVELRPPTGGLELRPDPVAATEPHTRRTIRWPEWSGFGKRRWRRSSRWEVQPSKTLWDWLQLLIVPAILVGIAYAYNAAQATREHRREDRRILEDRGLARAATQDAALLAYFAQEGDLMLKRQLLASSPAAELARTMTLATVHRLNGTRKAEIIRFLFEAHLLTREGLILDLADADLRRLDLAHAHVPPDISLRAANLRGARFDGTRLIGTDFSNSDLQGASFRGALLGGADFSGADLSGAVFDRATMGGAAADPSSSVTSFLGTCLSNTSFVGAHFGRGTNFAGVAGDHVDFSHAHGLELVNSAAQQLTDVRSEGATGRWPEPTRGGDIQVGLCTNTGPRPPGVDLGG